MFISNPDKDTIGNFTHEQHFMTQSITSSRSFSPKASPESLPSLTYLKHPVRLYFLHLFYLFQSLTTTWYLCVCVSVHVQYQLCPLLKFKLKENIAVLFTIVATVSMYSRHSKIWFLLLLFVVLGIEPRVLLMLGKHILTYTLSP